MSPNHLEIFSRRSVLWAALASVLFAAAPLYAENRPVRRSFSGGSHMVRIPRAEPAENLDAAKAAIESGEARARPQIAPRDDETRLTSNDDAESTKPATKPRRKVISRSGGSSMTGMPRRYR